MSDLSEISTDELTKQAGDIASKLLYKHENEALTYYKPYPQQLQFHQAKTPIRALVGRNKGGKSYAGAVEMLLTVGKVHPWRPYKKNPDGSKVMRVFGRSCCVDYRTLRETLIPIYRVLAPRNPCILPGKTFEGEKRIWPGLKGGNWDTAYNQTNDILMFEDGSKLEFMSYVQKRESFGGPVRHIIHHDEEPPDWIFGENVARQSTTGGADLLFTLTPIAYSQWLYNLLCEQAVANDKVTTIYIRGGEGPPLDADTKAIIETLITDEAERAARLEGTWTVLSGRVLKEYGPHNFIEPPIRWPDGWLNFIAIDPHEEKPTAVTWMKFDQYARIPYIYRELLIKGDVREICTEIKHLSAGQRIEASTIDISARKSASLRNQGSIIDEFEKYLPTLIEGTNHNKDVQRNLLKQIVKKQTDGYPLFFVTRDCPMTHNQLLNYSYKPLPRSGEDRSKPQIYKKNEDLVDTVIYHIQQIQHDIEDGGSVIPTSSGIGVYGNEFTGFNVRGIGM